MAETMQAVVKAHANPGLEVQQVPIPTIKRDEVLVKVRAASICGTDLHIYNWDSWAAGRMHPPVIVGHEVCGDVVERGSMVETPEVGDFVSLESHVICNQCAFCRTGLGHICENTKLIGVDRDGGFAEYIAIHAQNAWPNPEDLPVEIAVLQENFGNAVHTAFAADLRAKKVLVTGCGPVGLMTIAVARAIGARSIYATDISAYRIDFARRMGADLAMHAVDDPVLGNDLSSANTAIQIRLEGVQPTRTQPFHIAPLEPVANTIGKRSDETRRWIALCHHQRRGAEEKWIGSTVGATERPRDQRPDDQCQSELPASRISRPVR